MSVAEQLYKLQQVDLELDKKQQELTDVESRLSDSKALATAESRLASQKEQLADARKKQKSSEWELEDLQEKIRQIDNRLYSGKTKDPKELVNLEKEVKGLKSQAATKEDTLLGLMSLVEDAESQARATTDEVGHLKRECEQRQETLGPRKSEIEMALSELKGEREELAEQIDSEDLKIYERIRLSQGHAVAKVERGRCLGCHITVPTSQWQKAKVGGLIQCSNCSRILYVE